MEENKNKNEFVIENGILISCRGSGKVVVPDTVTAIGEKAFEDCRDVEDIILPDSVVGIDKEAFYCCFNLKSIHLPKGLTTIGERAFSLLPEPFEKLYIPATLKAFKPGQWSRFFYEADVSPDNHTFKAIDGSIFTADEKTLVYVKISKDGYKVPDGTEIIAEHSLSDVSGTVCIPASVTKIENEYGLGREITAIRTPKGSYAEQYAKEQNIPFVAI